MISYILYTVIKNMTEILKKLQKSNNKSKTRNELEPSEEHMLYSDVLEQLDFENGLDKAYDYKIGEYKKDRY